MRKKKTFQPVLGFTLVYGSVLLVESLGLHGLFFQQDVYVSKIDVSKD